MGDSLLNALLAFWRELRRRRVVRVALAYGAIGLGVMQVADTFFPALRLPDWSITLVAVLVILGFPAAGTHATDLRMEILALADHMAGRHERALATIEAMPLQPGLGDFAFVPWLGLGTARLLRGQLLAEAGRLRAPAHLALARTHDRAGDAEAAARHYAGFIELWEHADPELQPQVEAARRRLSQLVEAGRGP